MADEIIGSMPLQHLNRKWYKANKFFVYLYPRNGSAPMPIEEEAFNASIISLQMPDFQIEGIEEYIGGRWNMASGRFSLPQLSMTLRDSITFEGSGQTLSKWFNEYAFQSKKGYYDDWCFVISVMQKDPYGLEDIEILTGTGLLTAVSGFTFAQDTDQILEFSINISIRDIFTYGEDTGEELEQ